MNPFARAADYLTKHGWTQGVMRDVRTGKICCLGAFLYANPELRGCELDRAGAWLARFLIGRSILAKSPIAASANYEAVIPYWNDRIATGQEEVVAEFRAAAEAWDLEQALELEQAAERRPEVRTYSGGDFSLLDFDLDPATVWLPVGKVLAAVGGGSPA